MSLIRTIAKATTTLGMIAAASFFPQNTQAQFTPVNPGQILSGSVGFTDIYALASQGRQDFSDFGTVSENSEFDGNGKSVRSNIDSSTPILDQLVTTNGSTTTSLDFATDPNTNVTPLTIDSLGRIDGIATLNAGGISRLVPVTGRAIFREYVGRIYEASDVSTAGEESSFDAFSAYETQVLNRNIDHELVIRGNDRQGFSFVLNLRARAYQQTGLQIKNSYDPTPNLLRGTLRTRSGKGSKTGVSQVEVIGLIDERAFFEAPRTSLVANSNYSRWRGTATLTIPSFNPSPITGGVSAFNFSFYRFGTGSKKDRVGSYSISQRNSFSRRGYSVVSRGSFLNTQEEVALAGPGFISLGDLQYRDRVFAFRTPSAVTVIKSLYTNPDSILIRNDSEAR